METAKTRYLFVVRHGQRKDHLPDEYPEYRGHPDAPLTPIGHKQALETATHLKRYLKENFSDNEYTLKIESSPFIRCLQTSHKIL